MTCEKSARKVVDVLFRAARGGVYKDNDHSNEVLEELREEVPVGDVSQLLFATAV
eukprot:COSAG06_NODE_46902_length_343_cov_0.893443_1_plen_55_part_00